MTAIDQALPGRRLGRYQLERSLGAGPTGETFVATAPGPLGSKSFALKVLHSEFFATAAASANLAAACRSYAGLQHLGIVRLHELRRDGSTQFVVFDLVNGVDLDQVMQATVMSPGAGAAVLIAVARAVGGAHGRGTCHLGLTGRNVLIDRRGQTQVTDFGFMGLRLPPHPLSDPRLADRLAGLAPEQLSGQSTSPATDVFQLGLLGYRLMAGRDAFGGSTPEQTADNILNRAPQPTGLATPLDRVLNRALSRSQLERFPDASTFASQLEDALRHHPLPGNISALATAAATLLDSGAIEPGKNSSPRAATAGKTPSKTLMLGDMPMRVPALANRPSFGGEAEAPVESKRPSHLNVSNPGAVVLLDETEDLGDSRMLSDEESTVASKPLTEQIAASAKVGANDDFGLGPAGSKPGTDPGSFLGGAGKQGTGLEDFTEDIESLHEDLPIPVPPRRSAPLFAADDDDGIRRGSPGNEDVGLRPAPKKLQDEVGLRPAPKKLQDEVGLRPVAKIQDEVGLRPVAKLQDEVGLRPVAKLQDEVGLRPVAKLQDEAALRPATRRTVLGTAPAAMDAPAAASPIVRFHDPSTPPDTGRALSPTAQESFLDLGDDDAGLVMDGAAQDPMADEVSLGMTGTESLAGADFAENARKSLGRLPLEAAAEEAPVDHGLATGAPPNPRLRALVYALLILVVGGGGLLAFSLLGSEETPVAVASKSTTDSKIPVTPIAEAKTKGKPTAQPERTAPVAPVETAPVAPVETAPVAPVETAPVAPVETAPVAPVETAPVPNQPAVAGTLIITTNPPAASLYLDGSLVGQTPVEIDATTDQHSMAILKAGYKLHTANIDGAGAVNVELEEITPTEGPAGIKVRCRNKNRYYVFVDGQDVGQLCPTERIGVTPGQHTVEIYDPVSDSRRRFDAEVKGTRNSLRIRVD